MQSCHKKTAHSNQSVHQRRKDSFGLLFAARITISVTSRTGGAPVSTLLQQTQADVSTSYSSLRGLGFFPLSSSSCATGREESFGKHHSVGEYVNQTTKTDQSSRQPGWPVPPTRPPTLWLPHACSQCPGAGPQQTPCSSRTTLAPAVAALWHPAAQ